MQCKKFNYVVTDAEYMTSPQPLLDIMISFWIIKRNSFYYALFKLSNVMQVYKQEFPKHWRFLDEGYFICIFFGKKNFRKFLFAMNNFFLDKGLKTKDEEQLPTPLVGENDAPLRRIALSVSVNSRKFVCFCVTGKIFF